MASTDCQREGQATVEFGAKFDLSPNNEGYGRIEKISFAAYNESGCLIEARYFNVTTDYILGLSDIKRDLSGQIRMNQEMDQCYDIVLRYNNLTDTNKKTLQCLLKRLEQAQLEEEEADIAEEVLKNAEDSHM